MHAGDAATVARLHAASWRIAYRNILSAAYLGSAIDNDRNAVWAQRLNETTDDAFGLVAEVGHEAAAFAYVLRRPAHPYGNHLDNIHVAADFARQGIGRRLFAAISDTIIQRDWSRALQLWVYDANVNARQFYDALGGVRVDGALRDAPDGQQIPAGRYFWHDLVR